MKKYYEVILNPYRVWEQKHEVNQLPSDAEINLIDSDGMSIYYSNSTGCNYIKK